MIVAAVPVSHLLHLGTQKLNTAALLVQELLTVALQPASRVVVVPTAIVAALPVSHLSHFGIQKSNTASAQVPVFVTVAEHPASKVVVDHTVIVAHGH